MSHVGDSTQNEAIMTRDCNETHQKVWQADGVVRVFYEPLGRDGRVASHLPTDKQADSSDQLQLCPGESASCKYKLSHPISHYEGRAGAQSEGNYSLCDNKISHHIQTAD